MGCWIRIATKIDCSCKRRDPREQNRWISVIPWNDTEFSLGLCFRQNAAALAAAAAAANGTSSNATAVNGTAVSLVVPPALMRIDVACALVRDRGPPQACWVSLWGPDCVGWVRHSIILRHSTSLFLSDGRAFAVSSSGNFCAKLTRGCAPGGGAALGRHLPVLHSQPQALSLYVYGMDLPFRLEMCEYVGRVCGRCARACVG